MDPLHLLALVAFGLLAIALVISAVCLIAAWRYVRHLGEDS
jgi:hypothetical protein